LRRLRRALLLIGGGLASVVAWEPNLVILTLMIVLRHWRQLSGQQRASAAKTANGSKRSTSDTYYRYSRTRRRVGPSTRKGRGGRRVRRWNLGKRRKRKRQSWTLAVGARRRRISRGLGWEWTRVVSSADCRVRYCGGRAILRWASRHDPGVPSTMCYTVHRILMLFGCGAAHGGRYIDTDRCDAVTAGRARLIVSTVERVFSPLPPCRVRACGAS